ncbi:MAG: molybdopterin-binding protein [Syntrophobacterales bacterium]|nr:molybdopterin-binding protein [Syntrophobacterales bacterium]
MKKQILNTEQAAGKMLCHDMTQILRGQYKGPRFRKGHIIREEDIPILLSMGKHHIALIELGQDELHEEDAGLRLALALTDNELLQKGPSEGKFELFAPKDGLLKINTQALLKINRIPHIAIATLPTLTPVKEGAKIAGAKVVPLAIREKYVSRVENIAKSAFPVITVLPFKKLKIGAVITGREICEGKINDEFAPVLQQKAEAFQLDKPDFLYVTDDRRKISQAIQIQLAKRCELVLVTGGMSVDPDDVTPSGIRMAGAKIIRYGAPVMPGAMFLMAYKDNVPIIGVPGCAMYANTTILDLLLPRILAGEKITSRDISQLGHGGLCRNCIDCVYPVCAMGKIP